MRLNVIVFRFFLKNNRLPGVCRHLLFYAALCCAAPPCPEFPIVQYGTYVTAETGFKPAHRLPTGRQSEIGQWRLVDTTTIVRAALGVCFGMTCTVPAPLPENTTTVTVQFSLPRRGMKTPEQDKPVRQFSFPYPVDPGGLLVVTYKFEEPWEIVKGRWRITVLCGDTPVASKRFSIRPTR